MAIKRKQEARKQFFFEKKNQKTSPSPAPSMGRARPIPFRKTRGLTKPKHQPSGGATLASRLNRSDWRDMPVLAKMRFRCVRAVLGIVPMARAACASDCPVAKACARRASAGVRSSSAAISSTPGAARLPGIATSRIADAEVKISRAARRSGTHMNDNPSPPLGRRDRHRSAAPDSPIVQPAQQGAEPCVGPCVSQA